MLPSGKKEETLLSINTYLGGSLLLVVTALHFEKQLNICNTNTNNLCLKLTLHTGKIIF